jgi:phosphatidylserine/phosphatidylglycerophosphate/cardiolipin synthase-like enzyme
MSFTKAPRVYTNCDMALIAWQADLIIGCRGFALQREVAGAAGTATDDFVNTYVGFVGGQHTPGQSEPSTIWPVQRYSWNDYGVSQGQKVRYRIIPMMGSAAALTKPPQSDWSLWSNWIVVGTGQTPGFEAYFNRGIVGAQFLAEQAQTQAAFTAMLNTDIKATTPTNPVRDFLSGPLRIALLNLLQQAARNGVEIYAALYELNDEEIISAFEAIGKNCNLLLGSGAFKPGEPDENAVVRARLKANGKINVFDRLVTGQHFAHNKFIVFCDRNSNASTLWTGSTNTTVTGLCTQVNNGLLIEDRTTAAAYLTRWHALQAAGAGYPPSLAAAGSVPAKTTFGTAPITAWNVPCTGFVDLNDASNYIKAAKEGVLFLMFNPGTGGGKRAPSLLQDIQSLGDNGLYIHGVINQAQTAGPADPTGKNSTIQFSSKNSITDQPKVPVEAITPHHLTAATMNWFHQAFQFNMVMIHSKVIVIDPFGDNPVVMTGSHNMGPKASQMNDDNLVIIQNASGLACEYAVNILGVYGHYKWLYNAWAKANATAPPAATGKKAPPVPVAPTYDGNVDSDQWQTWESTGANLQQLQFMMGIPITPIAAPPASPTPPHVVPSAKKTAKKAAKTTGKAPLKQAAVKKVKK